MNLGAGSNQLVGGWTLTSDGTLNIGITRYSSWSAPATATPT